MIFAKLQPVIHKAGAFVLHRWFTVLKRAVKRSSNVFSASCSSCGCMEIDRLAGEQKKGHAHKKRLGDSLQECAESFLDKPNALFVSLFSHFFFDALEFLDIGTFNRHSFLPKQFDERHDHQQQ